MYIIKLTFLKVSGFIWLATSGNSRQCLISFPFNPGYACNSQAMPAIPGNACNSQAMPATLRQCLQVNPGNARNSQAMLAIPRQRLQF